MYKQKEKSCNISVAVLILEKWAKNGRMVLQKILNYKLTLKALHVLTDSS